MRGVSRKTTGFTLVEMAIVLLIMGVILNGLLVAVGQSTENTRRLEAKNKLREIEEALYGFAQVQGRLPCPADDDTNGEEDLTGSTASGVCGLYHGMLPSNTLGLSGGVDDNGLLMDPWGNPYRYSVGRTPTGYRFTGTSGISSIFNNSSSELVADTDMLEVCDNTSCSNVVMSNVAPAVIVSMGKNGAEISGSSSAAEQENGYGGSTAGGDYDVTNSNTFVVTDYSEDNFDDMLTWISPHVLLSKMISAGKLP